LKLRWSILTCDLQNTRIEAFYKQPIANKCWIRKFVHFFRKNSHQWPKG